MTCRGKCQTPFFSFSGSNQPPVPPVRRGARIDTKAPPPYQMLGSNLVLSVMLCHVSCGQSLSGVCYLMSVHSSAWRDLALALPLLPLHTSRQLPASSSPGSRASAPFPSQQGKPAVARVGLPAGFQHWSSASASASVDRDDLRTASFLLFGWLVGF